VSAKGWEDSEDCIVACWVDGWSVITARAARPIGGRERTCRRKKQRGNWKLEKGIRDVLGGRGEALVDTLEVCLDAVGTRLSSVTFHTCVVTL
jgi:hypothetical protein